MGRMSAEEFADRLAGADLTIPARTAIEKHPEVLADLNRSQLEQGLDSTGKKMAKYKNSPYAKKKALMNPKAGGVRDLKLTGSLYNAIRYTAGSSGYSATSESDTGAYAIKRDGEQIFGLTPASIQVFRYPYVRNECITYLQQRLSGK